MSRTLRYQLPAVGLIRTELYGESAEVFDFLDASGEIDRLKRLDHLGSVRLAVEGAHHPRWEYTATILALIDRCRELPQSRLGRNVAVDGDELSASELLKCWALLLNVGHLTWTFTSERLLLLELWDHRRERMGLPGYVEPELRSWAAQILKGGEVFRLYQALAFVRLSSLGDARGRDVGRLRRLLTAYLRPTAQTVDLRLRTTYQRIRRIAYLGLDTLYVSTPLTLDLGRLMAEPQALSRLVVLQQHPDEDELRALDAYLSESVYTGRDVLQVSGGYEPELRLRIRRYLRRNGLNGTVEALADGSLMRNLVASPIQVSLRTLLKAEPPFDDVLLPSLNPRTEQSTLERLLANRGARGRARVAVWPSAARQEWILQFHAPVGDHGARAAGVGAGMQRLGRVSSQLHRAHHYLGDRLIQELVLGAVGEDLLLAALAVVFEREVRWEWKPMGGLASEPTALLGPRSILRSILRKTIANLGRDKVGRARQAEMRAVITKLRRRPTDVAAVTVSNIVAVDAVTGKELAEFDGVLLEDRSTHLLVTVVEAKTGTASSRYRAGTELQRVLGSLRPRPTTQIDGPHPMLGIGRSAAFVELRAPFR